MNNHYIADLEERINREVRICAAYGMHPTQSKTYLTLHRRLTAYVEDSKPAVLWLKRILLTLISVAIPALLWTLAYTAHAYIVLLNQP